MSKASTETFLKQIQSGKIKTDKEIIYNHIKNNPGAHIRELKKWLYISHPTCTARISELLDIGVIKIVGENNNYANTVSKYEVETDPFKIELNKLQRKIARFEKWKKKAEEFRSFLSDDVNKELNNDFKSYVYWICLKNLYMDELEREVFTKGKSYKQVDGNNFCLIDNEGEEHIIIDWISHFKSKDSML